MIEVPVWESEWYYDTSLVDDEDFDLVSPYRWHMSSKGYARAWITSERTNMTMSRWIMGLKKGDPREMDHTNRNKLDNQKSNLRIATRALNAQNQPSSRGSSSSYRGVYWIKRSQRWGAKVRLHGKAHYLGTFLTEDEAGAVVSAWRRENMPFSVEGKTG